jgi:predicted nuclease of restriction endonuclease-like (RecB) superfamily
MDKKSVRAETPEPPPRPSVPPWYPDLLDAVVAVIPPERTKSEWLLTYWSIGQEILRWQPQEGWTARVIDHLSTDLKTRFPTDRALSPRNLRQMRAFAEAWPHEAYARGPLSRLPWHHHIVLLHKFSDRNLRLWYAKRAVEDSWTRATLLDNINTKLHREK